jgi:hypothetical protein
MSYIDTDTVPPTTATWHRVVCTYTVALHRPVDDDNPIGRIARIVLYTYVDIITHLATEAGLYFGVPPGFGKHVILKAGLVVRPFDAAAR